MVRETLKTIRHSMSGKRLGKHIDKFDDAGILVIGDIILDKYLWGEVSRISPEAPVPVVGVKKETEMLGGAANVLHNLATLGAKPVICGVIGDDNAGGRIVSMIEEMGLSTEGVFVEKDRPTSMKTRVVAHSQQVVRFDREICSEPDFASIRAMTRFVENRLAGMDALVVSDYGKGVVSSALMEKLRDIVRSGPGDGIIIAVDPKTGNFEYYHGVDVITPNHHEAGLFCGFEIVDEETLLKAGEQMLGEIDCRCVLITQGRDGMTLFEKGADVVHIPTLAKKVFDVTGAGDTVISSLALALASGLDFRSAAVLSNFAAGVVVGEVGTSTIRAKDLKAAVEKQ